MAVEVVWLEDGRATRQGRFLLEQPNVGGPECARRKGKRNRQFGFLPIFASIPSLSSRIESVRLGGCMNLAEYETCHGQAKGRSDCFGTKITSGAMGRNATLTERWPKPP